MPRITQIRRETPPVVPPLRVAAYCRVSSDSEDQLHSYAAQIKYYTEYIGQQSNWVLADIFADEAVSGMKTEKREDLKRLIADCRRGKIDRVLCKSVSRFCRNTYDSLALARQLKRYGVSIRFEEQDIDTGTMSDEFIYTMQSMAAQGESMTISQNMRWHYRDVMESGDFVGTIPAYGYRLAGRTLEIYEPEAAVVRRIFSLYLSGYGKQSIANILNGEGVPRRYGNEKWYVDTISYIINNERVIGDALLQKSYSTDDFPFQTRRNRGEKPQYYVENSHPAIVSKADFEAAQRLQAERRRNAPGGVAQGGNPLTGKILCPDCGHPFRRMLVGGVAYRQCGYHASGRRKCGGVRFPEEAVHDAFTLLANKLVMHREAILSPMLDGLERMQNRTSVTQSKVYEVDRRIAALNEQIHTLTQHRSRGWLDAAGFAAKSGAVSQQISALRAERRKLLAEDENDGQIDELRGLDNTLALTDLQTGFDGRLFGRIVTSVTAVSPTALCFKLKGGLMLTETVQRRERRCNRR
jgi:DNA invertase Pin-like site-specific DNA recombinase